VELSPLEAASIELLPAAADPLLAWLELFEEALSGTPLSKKNASKSERLLLLGRDVQAFKHAWANDLLRLPKKDSMAFKLPPAVVLLVVVTLAATGARKPPRLVVVVVVVMATATRLPCCTKSVSLEMKALPLLTKQPVISVIFADSVEQT